VNSLQIDRIIDISFFENVPIGFISFEFQVIFPALDIRVKNVAGTYSLEHKGESDLFSQLFDLLQLDIQNDDGLRRELASCTGAIQTCLSQHMSKEEEQVGCQYHTTIYPFKSHLSH
jgi:zinc finger-like protein